jgi:hypothetical protein
MAWQRDRLWALAALFALVAAVLVVAPAQARPAPRLIDRHGKEIRGKPATWLQQSRMPLVGGRVRLIIGSCPHRPKFSGCVYPRRPRWLWMKMSAYNPKSVLYHELGHTFDFELLRRSDRKKFKRVMHLKQLGWFAGNGPPSELFAEAYALCSRFGMKRPSAKKLDWTRSLYHYRPSRAQHKANCTIIKRAGAPERQKAKPKPQPPANPPPVIEEERPPQQQPSKQPGGVLPPGLPAPPSPADAWHIGSWG